MRTRKSKIEATADAPLLSDFVAKITPVFANELTPSRAIKTLSDLEADKQICTCPICLELLVQPVSLSVCGHIFCKSCIAEHRAHDPKCPVCRNSISTFTPDFTAQFMLDRHILPELSPVVKDEYAERARKAEAAFARARTQTADARPEQNPSNARGWAEVRRAIEAELARTASPLTVMRTALEVLSGLEERHHREFLIRLAARRDATIRESRTRETP